MVPVGELNIRYQSMLVLYKATQIGLSSTLHAITLIINTGLSLVDFILGVPSILLEFRIYKALEHF